MTKRILSLNYRLTNACFFILLTLCTTDIYAQKIFRDDFNRDTLGSAWQTRYWSIVNGAAYNNDGGPLTTSRAFTDSSYTIETSAKGFSNTYYRQFRITFGQASLDNDSAYVLGYSQYGGGIMSLGRATDNIFYPEILDQLAIYPDYNAMQWYKFKIVRYKSGLIQVYVNTGAGYSSTPLLEAIDSAYQTLGHFGWQEDSQTASVGFYVDFIQATKPLIEKPAVREKPAEDALITQVSAKSGRSYKVAKLTNGVKQYTDRDFTITSVPPFLNGASFIQGAMDDKFKTSNDFLTFFVKKDAIIYIAYDRRATAIPAWLNSWTKTGDIIGTTDGGSAYLEVYSRLIESSDIYPHPFILGGNLAAPAAGAEMNYLVAAVERPNLLPLQAENALLSGPVVANNHIGYIGTGFADFQNNYNDYIEWTVNITVPGNYNLNLAYANGGKTDRPLQISADGNNLTVLPFSPVASWDSWGFVSGPNAFLSAGTHKIRATAIGYSGPNIDQLGLYYLSAAPTTTLAAAGRKPREIAESNVSPALSYKAFPNPFVSSATIYYTLPEKTRVTLTVYSLQGQQIQVLVNSVKNAGAYQAIFNAAKLPAGTYLFRLQAGNQVNTGKLLKQ